MRHYFVQIGQDKHGPYPHAQVAAALKDGKMPAHADIIDVATGDVILPDELANFVATAGPAAAVHTPDVHQPYSQEPGWHCAMGAQRFGPVPLATLQSMVASGQLGPGHQVWCEGWPAWAPAGSIPQLFRQAPPPQGGMQFLLPVGPQSLWAILAGYLALGSLLLGPLAGIPAIFLGLLGWRDIAQHPQKRGKGRAIFAIVMGAITSLGFVAMFIYLRNQK